MISLPFQAIFFKSVNPYLLKSVCSRDTTHKHTLFWNSVCLLKKCILVGNSNILYYEKSSFPLEMLSLDSQKMSIVCWSGALLCYAHDCYCNLITISLPHSRSAEPPPRHRASFAQRQPCMCEADPGGAPAGSQVPGLGSLPLN